MENEISCEDLFLSKEPNQIKLDTSLLFNFETPFDPTNFKIISYNLSLFPLKNDPGPLELSLDSPKLILSKKHHGEDIKLLFEMRLDKVFLSCLDGNATLGTEVQRTKIQKIRNDDTFKVGPYVFHFLINNDDILEYKFWLFEDGAENFGSMKKKKVKFDTKSNTPNEFHLTDEILRPSGSPNANNNDYCTIITQNDKYFFKSNYNFPAYFLFRSRGESRKMQRKKQQKHKILIGSKEFDFQIEKIVKN